MKKIISGILIVVVIGMFVFEANAQMMRGFSSSIDWDEIAEHTLREEKEGKELWEKFQAKEIRCAEFNDEQFSVLGEYFMGAMMGDSHAAMNAMLIQIHGEDGEEQTHILMGKRLSGCDTAAVASGISGGWMPMMMGGLPTGQAGWSSPFGFNYMNNMMNFGYGFGVFGLLFMLLWWVLILAAIVALVKWLVNQFRGETTGKSAIEILMERYAKGEIDRKEFEEKKKDLS